MNSKNVLLVSTILLTLLVLFVMFLSAPVVSYFTNQSLKQQKLWVDIERLYLNPFTLSAEVTGLSIKHAAKPLLSFEQLAIDLNMRQLINGILSVDFLDVRGVNVQGEWQQNELKFAGWQPQQTHDKPQTKAAPAWLNTNNVAIHDLKFLNAKVQFTAEQAYQWQIEQLSLPNTELVGGKLTGDVKLVSQLNNQPFNIELSISHQASQSVVMVKSATIGAKLSDFIQWLPQELGLSGEVLFTFDGQIKQQNQHWQIEQLTSELTLADFSATLPVADKPSALSLTALNVTTQVLNDSEGLKFAANSNTLTGQVYWQLSGEQLDWHLTNTDTSANSVIAKLASFSATDSKLTWVDDNKQSKASPLTNLTVGVELLTLGEGVVSQRTELPTITLGNEAPIEPLLALNRVDLKDLKASPAQISIDEIELNLKKAVIYKSQQFGAENWLFSTIDNAKRNAQQIARNAEGVEASQVEAVNVEQVNVEEVNQLADEPVTSVKIGKFTLVGARSVEGTEQSLPEVVLYDYTPSEQVTQRVLLSEFSIENINSATPTKPSSVNLLGQLNKRSSVKLNGDIYPFTPHQDLQLQGSLSSINLAPYSPYVIDVINHRITQGQMSADFNIALKAQQINGQVSTEIKAMALSENEQVNTTNAGNTVIPLSVAINQLTDEQGNIKLSFPLSGDINAPSLGLSGLISIITTKALKEAAKSYLIQTFLPYANIISVAMLASDTLFEISFEALPYLPEQTDLAQNQQAYAKQLAAVMKERNKAQLVICPVVTDADMGENNAAKLTDDKAKRTYLNRLGQQRLDTFVDYLVEQLTIEQGRIIHCDTQVAQGNKQGKPRLTFTVK